MPKYNWELFSNYRLFRCAGTDCITLSITLAACPIIAPREMAVCGFIVINVVISPVSVSVSTCCNIYRSHASIKKLGSLHDSVTSPVGSV